MVGKPKSLGRWEDIKMYLKETGLEVVDWIRMAQGRSRWCPFSHTAVRKTVNTHSDSPSPLSCPPPFKKKNIPETFNRRRLAIRIFTSAVSSERLSRRRVWHYYMFTKIWEHGSGRGIFKNTMPPWESQTSIPLATAPPPPPKQTPNHGRTSKCLTHYCCLVQGNAHILRTKRHYHPPPLLPVLRYQKATKQTWKMVCSQTQPCHMRWI